MRQGALSNLKILVVDDQAEARAEMVHILETLGVSEIFQASDGKDALEYVRGDDRMIDLILSDWNMPVMSGMEFFRIARAQGVATPFLIISARGDHNSIMEARSRGVEGYIRKPFSPEQIEARLRIVAARLKAA